MSVLHSLLCKSFSCNENELVQVIPKKRIHIHFAVGFQPIFDNYHKIGVKGSLIAFQSIRYEYGSSSLKYRFALNTVIFTLLEFLYALCRGYDP